MTRTWRWVFVSGTWLSCACGARTIDTTGFDGTGESGAGGRGGTSGSSASSGGDAGRVGAGGTSVSSGGASGRGGAGGSSSGGVFGAGGSVNPGGAGGSTNPGGAAGAGGSFTGMRSVTLVTDTFVIGPGEEAFKCQMFANPFGVSVDVFKTESHMPSGSHHMLAFFEDAARDGSVYDCGGLEFSPPLHGAQSPDYVREYPEGVGFRFEASEGLRFNMHWLNTTSKPINAKVELTIVAGPAGSAKQQAGFMFLNNLGISLAPHSKGTATKTCVVPSNVGIVELISHMHQRATHIVAKTASGRVIYESDDWDHPTPSRFSPPLSLGTDTSVTWTCSYDNPDDFEVGFGPSAATSEMCILNGTFFPAASRLSACL